MFKSRKIEKFSENIFIEHIVGLVGDHIRSEKEERLNRTLN